VADLDAVLKDHILGPAHVGFVVEDLACALAHACKLYGLDEGDVHYEPTPGVEAPTRFAFIEVGGLSFEFIQPCDDVFRQQLFAAPSGGGGINHLAWKVRDLVGVLKLLSPLGIVPGYVTPDGPVSIGTKLMVYLDPATTGGQMVELIEELAPKDG
jgi:hypothetical protein